MRQLLHSTIVVVWLLVSLQNDHVLAVEDLQESAVTIRSCRSNATHIAWRSSAPPPSSVLRQLKGTTAALPPLSSFDCSFQPMAELRLEAYNYLRERVLPFDEPFLETLGFDMDPQDPSPDGLSDGLVGTTIEYAIRAKILYEYADAIPREIWQEYVLNYLHVNEARSNWRPVLFDRLSPLLNGTQNCCLPEAFRRINTNMWNVLAKISGRDAISFVAGSTPLIFDPMSVLVFGYASCTGLSILLTSALRAVGIPARLAGTPAWHGDRNNGNHNWVEVWHDDKWHFLEAGEADLFQDDCAKWFCQESQWNGTPAYAARLERGTAFFRMAWEWNNEHVPADDRTEFYQQTCGKCPG